ncbi:hypothetical protein MHL31_00705 [Lutibacter sp. A80]|uniref:hypothetical protein n=1 Tax=Lutibacter sp. A80 TaxID=2918453 RepID=UPI001F05D30D|nr:hypothetical protein [Lutibacter sp. A80]UMB60747.1 hypothetical protein MHL31_00705 [Lutibacter sp. A80]
MKKYMLLIIIGVLSISCNGQNSTSKLSEAKKNENNLNDQPKGSWKVNKEFDENGNLIKYDSIYSWSSTKNFDNLSSVNKDSLIQSFKSRFFKNYSGFKNEGFSSIFSEDSLFSNHFFNDDFFGSDFGKDFMDIDKIHKEMIDRQKEFLKKYQSKFLNSEDEN